MRRYLLALLGSLGLLLSACGGDESQTTGTTSGSGGTGGTGGGDGCIPLTISQTGIFRRSVGAYGIEARIEPTVPGSYRSRATFELYADDGTGVLPPLETGTFDLSKTPDDNYGTCQHCTMVVGYDRADEPERAFFQSSGKLELTKIDENDRSIGAGVLSDVKLVEVTQKPDFSWEIVPGGACYTIEKWSFDTTPVDGLPCDRAEDCPNTMWQVCDPHTSQCTHYQCLMTFDLLCPEGERCITQVPDESSAGACYTECTPFNAGSCATGSECVPIDPVQSIGICKKTGTVKTGNPCDEPDVSTGCEPGSVCAGYPASCSKICSYMVKDPGCPEGRVCGLQNACLSKDSGDPAPIGGSCAEGVPANTDCGADEDAFRGLCVSLFPEVTTLTCERTCRTANPDCPTDQYCAGLFENPNIGLCWPVPVCGDGKLDPVNEACDDGNAVSGDGCSSDCKTPELDVLCSKAEPLVLDQDIHGTNMGGPTGYAGSCRLYWVVPAKTYSFLPPGPGRLTLTMTSEKNLDLLVLGDCADAGSEMACHADWHLTENLSLDFATTPDKPVMIVVVGNSVADVGDFTLRAKFTPAVCGDGLIAGPEACDDGNTVGNDGCSADCSTIEWPVLCAGLPELSTSAPNTGDTTNGQNLINTDGFCTSILGSSNEAMFRYTAPKKGTLSLTLPEPGANFALSIMSGCGPLSEAAVTSCSNGGTPPLGSEHIDFEMNAGDLITVMVDGFRPDEAGPFSLIAKFQ
ncbi:Multiple EGF-like-domain protein 3 precursor [Minicystis rosea]|nr:Multiple EGF-like-domain protein 3 precursor [Minicystis rosea]